MLKEWPEDNTPVKFRDIVEPLYEAVLFAYEVKRKNKNKDIPYEGYELGEDELVTCISMKEGLSAEVLKWARDSHGESALLRILSVAVQLGIEQGRRVAVQQIRWRKQFEELTEGEEEE